MTRQEIEERAKGLAAAMRAAEPWKESVARAEYHLTDAVLATLEEAARAVCFDCRHGVVLHANKEGRTARWIHEDEEGDPCPCYSSEIHDLIAALKPKEGA